VSSTRKVRAFARCIKTGSLRQDEVIPLLLARDAPVIRAMSDSSHGNGSTDKNCVCKRTAGEIKIRIVHQGSSMGRLSDLAEMDNSH